MFSQRRRAYTVAEVADATGVSRPAIYREIRDRRLRAVTFGGRLVVPAEELDRLLDAPAAEPDAVAR